MFRDAAFPPAFTAANRKLSPTTPCETSVLNARRSPIQHNQLNEAGNPTSATPAIFHPGNKGRKRQFSKRTKTGCGTCRRRKKKCDEAKPKCDTCTRTGFVCEGYAREVFWSKNDRERPHPPLQAKEPAHNPTAAYPRYPDCSHFGIPQCQTAHRNGQPATDVRIHNRARSACGQLVVGEDHVAPRSWSESAQPAPIFFAEYAHPHCQPPMPDPSRTLPHPQATIRKTEKWRMLEGEPFFQSDVQLTSERALCTEAVHRFNDTASPLAVVARGDQQYFKRIVAAAWIPTHQMHRRSGAHISLPLGVNVNVTPPFHCDYGYNISIGDNVTIGPRCISLDSARIIIGSNTTIGSRVTISTLKTPTDTKSLKGSNGTEVACEIVIGKNVYIGDGVTIEAGVTIGDNAIIRAGSVVVRDVEEKATVRGNPAFG